MPDSISAAEDQMLEFKKLQQRLNHESIRHQFKKKVVGGLDEEDVTKYIEDIEKKFKMLEQNYRKAMDDTYILRSKLEEESEGKYLLEKKLSEAAAQINTHELEFREREMKYSLLEEQVREKEMKYSLLEEQLIELRSENEKLCQIEEENIQISELRKRLEEIEEAWESDKDLLGRTRTELESFKYKTGKVEEEITILKANNIELTNKVSAKDYKISEINKVCQDLKQELEIEKSCSEKLNMDLVIFKQKIISLENIINDKLAEIEEQRQYTESIERELSMEKARLLNYKVNGFKEELSEMYQKIEAMQRESDKSIQTSSNLYNQLTAQQNRADKAEKDMAEFMQLLSGAKDKFYNERNPISEQLANLVTSKKNEQ